jgi:hypothetical protein
MPHLRVNGSELILTEKYTGGYGREKRIQMRRDALHSYQNCYKDVPSPCHVYYALACVDAAGTCVTSVVDVLTTFQLEYPAAAV